MLTIDSKSTVKSHIDGGTFRVLAFAETRNRWGVAVTEWTTYRGAVVFQIHRVSDEGQMLRQGTFNTEAEARAAANRLYRRDK
ncbi:hypothetical protein AB0C42_24325 [Micromonospora taraxaci]|uniref:hypothetical protein n=1 Tax=Micromonospora taraxaci TaxID=1316803 RepID=UPI0033D74A5D